MKVCLISNSDGRGGGYAAAYRLHQALQLSSTSTTMIVGEKTRSDYTVLSESSKLSKLSKKLSEELDKLPLMLYPQRTQSPFSLQWVTDSIIQQIAQINPDLINLHWTNCGFLKIENIAKFNKPIVWTLHDMWAFTGGCHYSGDCERYKNSCGKCPQLGSGKELDVSRWIWKRKDLAWKNTNLTIVTPSNWLAQCAQKSSLFQNLRIEVISNGIDTNIYKPIDKNLARNCLNLPQNKKIILFGAMSAISDYRKGFHLLLKTVQQLSKTTKWGREIELVILGSSQSVTPPDFGFKTHYLGRLNDDVSMALAYASADIFIAPSIQDNLPNTVMEALACAVPCVAFNVGGMPDMIDHKKNGYLAYPFDTDDLASGITWILDDQERYHHLCGFARDKVEKNFSLEIQACKYIDLYDSL